MKLHVKHWPGFSSELLDSSGQHIGEVIDPALADELVKRYAEYDDLKADLESMRAEVERLRGKPNALSAQGARTGETDSEVCDGSVRSVYKSQ